MPRKGAGRLKTPRNPHSQIHDVHFGGLVERGGRPPLFLPHGGFRRRFRPKLLRGRKSTQWPCTIIPIISTTHLDGPFCKAQCVSPSTVWGNPYEACEKPLMNPGCARLEFACLEKTQVAPLSPPALRGRPNRGSSFGDFRQDFEPLRSISNGSWREMACATCLIWSASGG